jgi:hypothetical protein
MKQIIEMGSDAMIYTPSFIKIASSIQKFMGRGKVDSQTHREHGDFISILLFFHNNESSLKKDVKVF